MSDGYFDWFPSSMNEPHLSCRAFIAIDFAKMPPRQKSALRKAIKTGLLESYNGKVAALYRTLMHHYQWPMPHLWTKAWVGCRLRCDDEAKFNELAPFVAPFVPNDCVLQYSNNYLMIRKGVSPQSYYRPNAIMDSTPELVINKLIEQDSRDHHVVYELLEAIDHNKTIVVNKTINS